MRYKNCFFANLNSTMPAPLQYEMGTTPLNITFPKYTLSPPSCSNNVTYSYELVSKTPDLVYGVASPFADAISGLPNFYSVTSAGGNITISGQNYAEAWNTYVFRVILYESIANITNSDF